MSPPITKPTASSPRRPVVFCTLAFLLLLLILALHHPDGIPQTTLAGRFLSLSSNATLALHPHLAGTPPAFATSHYVFSQLSALRLPTHSVTYTPLLSYPAPSSPPLSAHFSDGSSLAFSPDGADCVRPYHAYSPSGAVQAAVVFANLGRETDYRYLEALGVSVSGRVVVVWRGGKVSRAEAVAAVESRGAAAVLLYTKWEGERGEVLVRSGAERGTVMRGGIGDPLTPGWAAVEGGEMLGLADDRVAEKLPKIPSLPLSFDDADVILRSLGGPTTPTEWGDPSRRVGPGPTVVNFTYQEEKRVAEIQNVFAVIRGSVEPDRYVVLGNHRDAWTYGAVDPNSGTAALLDVARRFSHLMETGWRPRRTIVICSWDAEEFGMVGSTEWVEQNLINLGGKAVAYLNVDCAVQGHGFFAGATPQLDNLILKVTKQVKDPDVEGGTVYGSMAAANQGISIQRLSGVDSDFAPFLQHAGVPSVDLYYGKDFPVYHTAFDTYEWITKNADPWFHRHVAIADIWGLIALHLADNSVLPFDYLSYAKQLQRHRDELSKLLVKSVYLHPIDIAIEKLVSASKQAAEEAHHLREQESRDESVALKLRGLNDRLMLAERGFLDSDGIHGRQWFKHLIYGLSSNHETKLDVFPGIADAIGRSTTMSPRDRAATIQHEIWRVARAIERAAAALNGELT